MANLPKEGRAFWLLEFRDGLRLDMAGLKEGASTQPSYLLDLVF
jgi:hypothetical protein